jgi:hypothetical protein
LQLPSEVLTILDSIEPDRSGDGEKTSSVAIAT